jgi:hypothetical protein
MLAIETMEHGTHYYVYAKNGDNPYLHHHDVSTSNFSAKTEPPSERTWVTFPRYQLLFGITVSQLS